MHATPGVSTLIDVVRDTRDALRIGRPVPFAPMIRAMWHPSTLTWARLDSEAQALAAHLRDRLPDGAVRHCFYQPVRTCCGPLRLLVRQHLRRPLRPYEEFRRRLAELGGTRGLLDNGEPMALMMPVLRADFKRRGHLYLSRPASLLPCHRLDGTDDPGVGPGALRA